MFYPIIKNIKKKLLFMCLFFSILINLYLKNGLIINVNIYSSLLTKRHTI
jgi:hypothetical protein